MSFELILFVLIHLGALIYLVETLRRVIKRSREYELAENATTLPFGMVKLRYVVVLYILTYVLWVLGSLVLYFLFVHGGSSPSSSSISNSLNL